MADKLIIPFRGAGKVSSTAVTVYDQFGKALPMTISDTEIGFTQLNVTTLQVGGTAVTSTAAELNILDGVTATAAELNTLDQSAQTETVTEAGAIDITINHTALDSTTAGFAATLAAPGADMLGKVKTIEMTADNGDVTIALTNVTGGSAATTCTFNDVNDALVLVGGTNKWHVVAESGVVLS